MKRLRGTLLLADGAQRGELEFDSAIRKIDVLAAHSKPSDGPAAAPFIAPGFIDVHVHGGGGGDTMDGPSGVLALARAHLAHGTTALLPTTITNPWDAVLNALDGVREVMLEQSSGGFAGELLPEVLGAHLEGPFISPDRLGAQPPYTMLPTESLLAKVTRREVVKVVTMAPEVEHAHAAAATFAAAGVRVSLGHTVAAYKQVAALVETVAQAAGVVGFTHLYNAMTPLGSREPGVVGAALSLSKTYAEVILDLHHVHAASFRAALAAKPDRLMLITDAIRAAGTGETHTELGGVPVTVRDGAARLADGTLAGSVLTLDRAVRNAVGAGLRLHEAVRLASAVPARYLGLDDRGSLEVGRRADFVVLDGDLQVVDVFVAGRGLN